MSSKPPGRFYANIVASLTKMKTVLNLIISDLVRFIFAVMLFLVALAIVVAVLFYRQWSPQVIDFIKSAATDTSSIPQK